MNVTHESTECQYSCDKFSINLRLLLKSVAVRAMMLFIFVNVWELKAIEEPELLKRLGEDYSEYRKRTPMFFPDFGKIFKRRKP